MDTPLLSDPERITRILLVNDNRYDNINRDGSMQGVSTIEDKITSHAQLINTLTRLIAGGIRRKRDY